jgi:hypothetical protein
MKHLIAMSCFLMSLPALAAAQTGLTADCSNILSYDTAGLVSQVDQILPSLVPQNPNDRIGARVYKTALNMKSGLQVFQLGGTLNPDQLCALQAICEDDGSMTEAVYECN